MYVCKLFLLLLCWSDSNVIGWLRTVVYQSVIRTCSHELVLDTTTVSEAVADRVESDFTSQKITYRDYIGLWTTLMHLSTVKVHYIYCI